MRWMSLFILLSIPFTAFCQNEIGPEGSALLAIIAAVLLLPLLFFARRWFWGKVHKPAFSSSGRLRLSLIKNRELRPTMLYLRIENTGSKDIDIKAPTILFRKLWSERKFKLKGINGQNIYPLYLDAGKRHELPIDLAVFHQYDRKLRKFYWAKVFCEDTKGRRYKTHYVTLRKSLFS